MILLDTNILIEFLKKNLNIAVELKRLGISALAINSVVAAELYQGALNAAELRLIQKALLQFKILPLSPAIEEVMLELIQQYALSHRLKFPDALIAATAIHYNMPLYTLNRKDFRYMSELILHEPA